MACTVITVRRHPCIKFLRSQILEPLHHHPAFPVNSQPAADQSAQEWTEEQQKPPRGRCFPKNTHTAAFSAAAQREAGGVIWHKLTDQLVDQKAVSYQSFSHSGAEMSHSCSFFDVRICCFSSSFVIVNEEFGFGQKSNFKKKLMRISF